MLIWHFISSQCNCYQCLNILSTKNIIEKLNLLSILSPTAKPKSHAIHPQFSMMLQESWKPVEAAEELEEDRLKFASSPVEE